jgi:hypothetical protein
MRPNILNLIGYPISISTTRAVFRNPSFQLVTGAGMFLVDFILLHLESNESPPTFNCRNAR